MRTWGAIIAAWALVLAAAAPVSAAPPNLIDPAVDPVTGTPATVVTFAVTYQHPGPPRRRAKSVQVVVGGRKPVRADSCGAAASRRLGATRRRSGARDDGDLVQNDRRVLDEDRVRQLGRSRHPDDGGAERTQQVFVGRMLRRGTGDIDRLAREMGQFALR